MLPKSRERAKLLSPTALLTSHSHQLPRTKFLFLFIKILSCFGQLSKFFGGLIAHALPDPLSASGFAAIAFNSLLIIISNFPYVNNYYACKVLSTNTVQKY